MNAQQEVERLSSEIETIRSQAELDMEHIHEAAGGRDDETAHDAVVRLRRERDAALEAL